MAIIVDYYPTGNETTPQFYTPYSMGDIGQSFTGDGGILHSVKFYLRKYTTTSVGYAYVTIYNETHTTGFGIDSVPTGSVLATSHLVEVIPLSTTVWKLVTFYFFGDNKIELINGNKYCVNLTGTENNSANQVYIAEDGLNPTHNGNMYRSGYQEPNRDCIFYVYKDSPPEVTFFPSRL